MLNLQQKVSTDAEDSQAGGIVLLPLTGILPVLKL